MSAFTSEVTGQVSVSNFPAVQDVNITQSVEVEVKNDSGSAIPVTGPLTDTQLRATPVAVVMGQASTATSTQFTSTGANQTLLAANANRKKLIIYVTSGIWDLKLGAVASATSRLLRIDSAKFYLEITGYTGQVDGICTTSNKILDVTELV